MTNEEMTKRINEIDNEREQLKQEKEKYLRQLETVKLKNKYKEHKKCIGNCYIATKYREKYPHIIAFKIIDVPDSSYQDRAVCITISSNNFPKCLSVNNEILSLWSHDRDCLMPTEGALQVIDKYRRISSEEFDDMLNEHFQKILTDKKN